jgi:DNA-binding NtrC family response regulator
MVSLSRGSLSDVINSTNSSNDYQEGEMPMIARILIIDDEPRWISFAKDNLGTTFEVEVATDLEEALTKLKKDRYDLIIASSRRVDVLEAISKKFPEKRVVVATGQPTTREAISIYRLGALDYFAKDFRREVVSEKVREAIQKPVKAPA